MLTMTEARALVVAEINRHVQGSDSDSELVVLDELTIERPWGWVFFYQSRRYAETRNELYALVGNAPYIVNRADGTLEPTGTANSVEHYIARYEEELEERSKRWTLTVHDDPAGAPQILKALRAVLGLTLAEAAELKRRLPGVVDRGARARLAPLYDALRENGISAELHLASDTAETGGRSDGGSLIG